MADGGVVQLSLILVSRQRQAIGFKRPSRFNPRYSAAQLAVNGKQGRNAASLDA